MTHQSVANAEIVKIDDEKRLVFGWASIIKDEGGKILLDRQDDFIDSEDELESAAYDYVLKSRDGGEMHVRRGVAKMVESVVFTEEKQRALGIPVGSMPTGWWIGFKVNDDRVWQQVKKGEYAGFSVHGTGKRQSTELPLSKITEIGKADKKKKKNKIATVMGEFKRGKLKSSSGEKVTDPKQAMAIAISEQKRAKMKKISLSHIIGKVEELAKVGDKPGHPFRGNQYTSGKARPRIGGGSAPSNPLRGGSYITPVGSRTGSGTGPKPPKKTKPAPAKSKAPDKTIRLADGTPMYARLGQSREAMTSPNTPKATKQRLAAAKPLDGGGKRVYSNTLYASNTYGDRMKNPESTDVHVFAERVGKKTTYRIEIHSGRSKSGKLEDLSGYDEGGSMSRSGMSPTFGSLKEAKSWIGNLGGGGMPRRLSQNERRKLNSEPVDFYGLQ